MRFDPDELQPPSPERVAARALILAVVSCRGFIDGDGEQAKDYWRKVREWYLDLSIDHELETWERHFIDTPFGELQSQQRIDASWLCEGLAVLAWALGRFPMPAADQQVIAADVADALGFLKAQDRTPLLAPSLRPTEDLAVFAEAVFSIDWRLVEFGLRPSAIDFAEVARTVWFGPLCLDHVRLSQGDLAVRGVPIFRADPTALGVLGSITRERHRAANWLIGAGDPYSEAPIDT